MGKCLAMHFFETIYVEVRRHCSIFFDCKIAYFHISESSCCYAIQVVCNQLVRNFPSIFIWWRRSERCLLHFNRRYENDDSITMRKIVAFHNKTSFLRWRLPEHYFYCCLLSDLMFNSKLFKLDSLYAHWINFEGSIACRNNKKLVYFINLSLRGILNEDNFCVVEIHECEKIRSSSNMQHTTNPENLEIHEARESSAKT